MGFVKIINKRKLTLISVFFFLYVAFNLLDGERGLISYFEKQKKIEELIKNKEVLSFKLNTIERKNSLLTDKLDLDYLEIMYRKKFLVGKTNEKIFIK
tara:strand:+ start:746 stop:1039 length:294 start_codon:yes stop_codon:yes gene_type:complete